MALSISKKSILALVAGMLLTFSFAPFSFWFISPLCIALFFYCLANTTWQVAAKRGFLFGFGWFACGISWVHVSIAEYGGLPLVVSLLLMAILAAYLALYSALAAGLSTHFKGHTWLLAFIPLFMASEWMRGTFLTGFPWLSFGYSLTDSPLNFLAPVVGEFGLTVIVLLLGYSLWQLANKKWLWLASTISSLMICALVMTTLPQNKHTGDEVHVLLVQGNIKQELRWAPEQFAKTMLAYQDLTRPNWDVDLVVWPEAAIPEVEALAQEYLQNLDSAAAFHNTALITGIVDYQRPTKTIYNTLIVLGKKNPEDLLGQYQFLHPNRYRKHNLLPIGEFVPFESLLRPIAPLFDLPMSSFSRGDAIQHNLKANGLNILPAICYEIVFADFVRSNYHSNSDILLTVSNDAWFGDSHGPHQHMQIARMRAMELGRPLIRVTNNGITGVYDPLDHQQQTINQFEATVLKTSIKKISGDTLYAQYGKGPIVLLLIVIFLVALFNNRHAFKFFKPIKTNK
ncbi:apolipoprotein N-acyltransferase [Pseudoalteromonas tunicata]|uniref:apolipoprotein N-acyltransferase n=1 Tax=Pseudoalteromonas tunicata TaxID=314281 RepID=UPI00273D0452|nr:apolipoprotein N-acyltransferase [Pseudoalteromonas tunicata]MDP5213830.1 apolipoprotein N-acyltransferase [Pseudoalteromonas tunicata]